MSLLEYAKRAAVRKLVYVAIGILLAAVGVGTARADVGDPASNQQHDPSKVGFDQGEAITICKKNGEKFRQQRIANGTPNPGAVVCTFYVHSEFPSYYCTSDSQPCSTTATDGPYFTYGAAKTCANRNATLGDDGGNRPDTVTTRCAGGCSLVMQPGFSTNKNTKLSDGTIATIYRGHMQYSGSVCGVATINPDVTQQESEKVNEQACAPMGGGEMACLKKNGDMCYTPASGRRQCWTPGEVGEKANGPELSKKTPTPNTPPLASPPIDQTWIKKGEVKNDATTGSTTTTNYVSTWVTSGGSNVPTNPNVPGSGNDGSTGDAGEGDGDDEENESSGGVTCENPPTSSGDPLLGNILTQTYRTRCDAEKRDTDAANALQAMADEGDGTEGVDVDSIFSNGTGPDLNETLLGGGTGGTCSFFDGIDIDGQTITVPPQFWEIVGWISTIFVALAYLWIAYMLGG